MSDLIKDLQTLPLLKAVQAFLHDRIGLARQFHGQLVQSLGIPAPNRLQLCGASGEKARGCLSPLSRVDGAFHDLPSFVLLLVYTVYTRCTTLASKS
jgi:hypothetical protein